MLVGGILQRIARKDLKAELGRSLWLAATDDSGLDRGMASHRADGLAEDVHLTSLNLDLTSCPPAL